MKTLSVKNLKKSTRTLYNFKGAPASGEQTTTTSGGTDPTNTTTTLLTTTHLMNKPN